jgi:hypothetical protein
MAAAVIQQQPAAIELRYLQTLVEIGAEHNTTIVFPLPIDLITSNRISAEWFEGDRRRGVNGTHAGV